MDAKRKHKSGAPLLPTEPPYLYGFIDGDCARAHSGISWLLLPSVVPVVITQIYILLVH
jgi:hypothetical protein